LNAIEAQNLESFPLQSRNYVPKYITLVLVGQVLHGLIFYVAKELLSHTLGSSFKARKHGIPFWRKLSEDYQVGSNYICQNEGGKRRST